MPPALSWGELRAYLGKLSCDSSYDRRMGRLFIFILPGPIEPHENLPP
jgi:hypothetical protein